MLLASTAALYVSALILGPPASSSCIRISAGGQLFAVRARKDSSRDRKQSWLPIAVLDALPRDQLDTLCCDGFLALRRDAELLLAAAALACSEWTRAIDPAHMKVALALHLPAEDAAALVRRQLAEARREARAEYTTGRAAARAMSSGRVRPNGASNNGSVTARGANNNGSTTRGASNNGSVTARGASNTSNTTARGIRSDHQSFNKTVHRATDASPSRRQHMSRAVSAPRQTKSTSQEPSRTTLIARATPKRSVLSGGPNSMRNGRPDLDKHRSDAARRATPTRDRSPMGWRGRDMMVNDRAFR